MKIPKKIHLTCKNKNNINNSIWEDCYNKYKIMYYDCEIILYDDNDIYNIIEKTFPQYIDKIKKIKVGAILADIFRYLILYLEGGIYSDMDCEPIKRIDELIDLNFTYFHGDESNNNIFFVCKKQEDLKDLRYYFNNNVCDNCKIIKTEENIETCECLGHKKITEYVSTILGYEYHKDWHSLLRIYDTYKNVSICQAFMITEPKQDIFLKMFLHCMDKIDFLINLSKQSINYEYNVIHTCGPVAFTKIILDNLSNKICILPSDFYCTGSYNMVPLTKNSYNRHLGTSSWR